MESVGCAWRRKVGGSSGIASWRRALKERSLFLEDCDLGSKKPSRDPAEVPRLPSHKDVDRVSTATGMASLALSCGRGFLAPAGQWTLGGNTTTSTSPVKFKSAC